MHDDKVKAVLADKLIELETALGKVTLRRGRAVIDALEQIPTLAFNITDLSTAEDVEVWAYFDSQVPVTGLDLKWAAKLTTDQIAVCVGGLLHPEEIIQPHQFAVTYPAPEDPKAGQFGDSIAQFSRIERNIRDWASENVTNQTKRKTATLTMNTDTGQVCHSNLLFDNDMALYFVELNEHIDHGSARQGEIAITLNRPRTTDGVSHMLRGAFAHPTFTSHALHKRMNTDALSELSESLRFHPAMKALVFMGVESFNIWNDLGGVNRHINKEPSSEQ